MAMRACSLNRSPATLSVPLCYSVSSKTSVQIPQPHSPSSPPSSSSSFSFSITKNVSNVLVSDDSLTIAAIVEAVSLANAAAEAAKDAISSALAVSKVGHEQLRNGEGDEGIDARESGMAARRRRRMMKKRRKDMEFYDDGADSGRYLVEGCSSRSERSRYLTRRQEAEFSLYLKVGAMLEAADSKCATTTARMERRRNTDKAFLRARECRERITLSYKRLVVSIAAPYQGKGLSLQDLIQVDPMLL